MLKNRTVIVLGAGASAEVGLPVGAGLAESIAKLVHFENNLPAFAEQADFQVHLQNNCQRRGEIVVYHMDAGREIARGIESARSIDRYIDRFHDDQFVRDTGKAAIVHCLLKAEAESKLARWPQKPHALKGTWYQELEHILFDGLRRRDVAKVFHNLIIVCFNYDRCVEQFLINSLKRSFSLEHEESEKLVNENLTVMRPYGGLGRLKSGLSKDGLDFGQQTDVPNVFVLGRRIRTFTEQIEGGAVDVIKSAIEEAQTLIFLGFGFHQSNLSLLRPIANNPNVDRIFASVKGLSAPLQRELIDKLMPFLRRTVTRVLWQPSTALASMCCPNTAVW